MDSEPTEGNINNVVTSDGLAKEFNKYNTEIVLGGVYDVSAHNNGAVFESLQALLSSSNLSTLIPTSVRHGGMSIRFIQGSEQSSDNKYVQYGLMTNSFSTSVSDWQGVDDKPIAGSDNLVKSKGVKEEFETLVGIDNVDIADTLAWIKKRWYTGTNQPNGAEVNYNTDQKIWYTRIDVSKYDAITCNGLLNGISFTTAANVVAGINIYGDGTLRKNIIDASGENIIYRSEYSQYSKLELVFNAKSTSNDEFIAETEPSVIVYKASSVASREEVAVLEEKVDSNSSEITELKSNKTEVDGRLNELETKSEEIQDAIEVEINRATAAEQANSNAISINSSKIRRVFDESAKFVAISGSSGENGITKEEANNIFRSISISKKLQGLFISVFYDNIGLRFTDGNKKVYAFDIAEYPDIMDKSIKSLTIEKNFDGTVFILNLNPSARVHRGFDLGDIEKFPISDDVYLSDGQLVMQEIENTKENLDNKFDKGIKKVLLQNLPYETGYVDSDTGNVNPLEPNIYFTYYFPKGVFNKLSMYFQWQGTVVRGMAFYEDGEYISGDAANNIRKVISIPNNANMLKYCLGNSSAIDTAQYFELINDKDYNANTLKTETDIRFKDYSAGYTYPNLVSLSLLGGGNIFYASGTIRNAGMFIKPWSNISYEPMEQKGIYKFKSESDIGTNQVFSFNYKRETPSKLYLSIQNIEGMKIAIRNNSNNILKISTPTVIGIYKDKNDIPSITGEIIYVNSEYIFMSVISNRVDQGNLRFSFEGISYTEILIKYPTVLEDNNILVDPNHYYQCEAEKNNSKWIGKNVMLFGDSQQNEQYVTIPLMNRFGFNIYNSAQGGHAIGFRTNEKNWLYSWNYDLMGNSGYSREEVLKNSNIDLYLMLVSTNDNPSDNDKLELVKGEQIGSTDYFKFTNEALDEIKENYPWYGDDEETITSKLSKFNDLSLDEKKRIFAYKQSYAAYIAQLLEFNPKAQFVLSTIPICPASFYKNDGEGGVKIKEGYTATDIRGNYTTFEKKNNVIKDVAKYFNLPVADGANYVNMTYENYHIFVNPGDYVHWTNQNNLIKRRWAQCIAGVIEDLYIE